VTAANLNRTRCLIGSQCKSRKRSEALEDDACQTILQTLKSVEIPLRSAYTPSVASLPASLSPATSKYTTSPRRVFVSVVSYTHRWCLHFSVTCYAIIYSSCGHSKHNYVGCFACRVGKRESIAVFTKRRTVKSLIMESSIII